MELLARDHAAIRAFQKMKNVPADGYVTADLLELLQRIR